MATTLPREVLRWVQSLDLAYSVKNVKRDFSNGFLVAEIISRYYCKEVQMHSFDNGTAVIAKKDNWAQIIKIISRIGMYDLITEADSGRMIRCEDGAAVEVITRMYETLTQRKITMATKKPTTDKIAGYTRDTGAWKVREALRNSDLNEGSDENTLKRHTKSHLDEHERSIQEGRSIDQDRFSQTLSIGTNNSQMPPRKKGEEIDHDTPQVRVKEITVKQLDRNVTHLRASKQMQNNSSMPSNNRPRSRQGHFEHDETNLATEGLGGNSIAAGNGMLPENALSLLNACISRIMSSTNVPGWNDQCDPYQNFLGVLELLVRRGTADKEKLDDLVKDVLSEIRISAQYLAEACIVTPKQFWKAADLLIGAISSCSYQSGAYAVAIETFESLGRWIYQQDPKASLPLFCDFALFKLGNILKGHPYKRLGILRILYAFSPHDTLSHVQCIKRLQAIIPDLQTFIGCLTIMATLETNLDASLLDLYLYYATIGLGMPSPRLRAGSAAVLSALYPLSDGLISPLLPQLQTLAVNETWWEIRAHLLSLSSSILGYSNSSRDPATDEGDIEPNPDDTAAISIVDDIFTTTENSSIRQWGLVALARAVGYSDAISSRYLEVLLSLDSDSRRFILDLDAHDSVRKISLPSSTGMAFVIEPIMSRMNTLCLIRALESLIIRDKLERLDMAMMQTLHASVAAVSRYGSDDGDGGPIKGPWIDIFTGLKDFILVSLCDPESVSDATGLLTQYILYSPLKENVITDNKFLNTMRLIYPPDPDTADMICQQTVEGFFSDIFASSDINAAAVVSTLEIFAKNYSSNFEVSNLGSLLKQFLVEGKNK